MGVKVVADTHVLVFYLFTPGRLTDTAAGWVNGNTADEVCEHWQLRSQI